LTQADYALHYVTGPSKHVSRKSESHKSIEVRWSGGQTDYFSGNPFFGGRDPMVQALEFIATFKDPTDYTLHEITTTTTTSTSEKEII
jgi:hypothetical protein